MVKTILISKIQLFCSFVESLSSIRGCQCAGIETIVIVNFGTSSIVFCDGIDDTGVSEKETQPLGTAVGDGESGDVTPHHLDTGI